MANQFNEDEKWKGLLAMSKPTFAGETEMPFGFLTNTLARMKAEKKDREVLERIGLRALFASLAVLVAVVGFSVGIQLQTHLDVDPTVKAFLQTDDLSIS